MRNRVCRMLASLLAIIMISTGIVFANGKKAEASSNVTYKITTYGDESTDYFGYIMTPDVDYKVQALIYIHGNGGIYKEGVSWPERLDEEMTKWIAQGYLEPMVIIVPRANIGDDDNQKGNKMKVFVDEQFEKLYDATATGTISDKIDTSKDVIVSGLSMGGAAALYAGVLFRDKIKNVGALSPANDFKYHWDDVNGWIGKSSNIKFNEESGSHYLLAASKTEHDKLHYNVCKKVYSVCGEKYGFEEYYLESGDHDRNLFMKELFYYLYYVQHDVVPSADICTEAAKKPTVLKAAKTYISGAYQIFSTLTMNTSNCNGNNLTYTWKRDGQTISGATSKTYKTTTEDAGKIISCEVRDSSCIGYLEGTCSAKIAKYMPPPAPTGLVGHDPSVLYGGDGKITGVDTTMEYATTLDFINAKPCTGTEITGLFAGDYYIRVAETDTQDAGIAKKITLYPGPEPKNTDPVTPAPTNPTTPVTPAPSVTEAPVVTTEPSKGGSFEDLIERLYVVALGRESDPEGKAFWAKEVKTGVRTGGDCAKEFLISPEFLDKNMSTEDFVEVLYSTFFDRASEPEGKAYWVNALKTNTLSKEEVIKCFVNSEEWCNICASYGVKPGATTAKATMPSANATEFASRLYTKCLGREAEEGGLKFWSLSLTNLEVTGTQAAYQFFTSDEFMGFNTSDEEYIERLYETFMGRASDPDGMAFWMKELKDGKTRDDILYGFAGSKEFTEICNTYGIDR